MRPDAAGEGDHFVGDRRLEVHAGPQRLAQRHDVPVLDMPAVLAQVQR